MVRPLEQLDGPVVGLDEGGHLFGEVGLAGKIPCCDTILMSTWTPMDHRGGAFEMRISFTASPMVGTVTNALGSVIGVFV